MSHVKAGGTAKNVHNNAGQRLGVKRFGGQKVKAGEVIVRQTGSTKLAGEGTYMSRNFTIHAKKDGVVTFVKTKNHPKVNHILKREKWNVIERAIYSKLIKKNKHNYWPGKITVPLNPFLASASKFAKIDSKRGFTASFCRA